MATKILVAVDGSPMALDAARYVVDRFGSTASSFDIRLLHAQYRIPPRAASAVGRAIVQSYYRDEAEQAQKAVRELLDSRAIAYRCVQKIGNPAAEISRYAEEEEVDLIVMGSHGLGAAKGLLLGSVAQGVIAGCQLPVLVVRGGGESHAKGPVLVAVDASAYTRRAIAYLLRRRAMFAADSQITLLHVAALQNRFGLSTAKSVRREALDMEHETAMHPARRLMSRARIQWTEARAQGDPGTEIATFAQQHGTGLIVMGSHGRGAMTGLLLGSVAQKTISACDVPVLIVR